MSRRTGKPCSATPIPDARIANDLTAPGVTPADRRRQSCATRSLQPRSRCGTSTRSNPVWSAALGVIYFSDSFASSDDSVRLPGFVRVDAAVYAKVNDMWRVQLNVENVFNKGYWATADGKQQHFAGTAAHLPRHGDRQILGVLGQPRRHTVWRRHRCGGITVFQGTNPPLKPSGTLALKSSWRVFTRGLHAMRLFSGSGA